MRFLMIIIWLFTFAISSSAQIGERERAVYKLFNKPSKIQWVKHFQGRIDDLNDIAITLAYDGKNCKGLLEYLRSKTIFKLDGKLNKEELLLEERDANGAVSGYLAAELNEFGITGEWSNFDHTLGSSLVLQEIKLSTEYPSNCGDNKWINIYKGAIGTEEVEMILQKGSDFTLRGIAYALPSDKSFELDGQFTERNDFMLEIRDDNGNLEGTLSSTVEKGQPINVKFSPPGGTQTTGTLQLVEALELGCIEYADYISSYDIIYPKTQSLAFNRWMSRLTDDWVADVHSYSASVKKINPTLTPSQRATIRAYAWSDIEFYNHDIISGYLSFSNTWSAELKGRAFNFDLRSGHEITLADIFLDSFQYEDFIRQYIHNNINKHLLYRDYEFREWLSAAAFPYFTIRKEGISFCTQFNPVYGQQHITIPYVELYRYMKKDNPVRDLAQLN